MFAMTAAMMLQQEQASNHHNNEETMAPFSFSNGGDTITKTTSNETDEEFTVTVTPTTSNDWSSEQEYLSDTMNDDDEEEDIDTTNDNEKVNGTGLILYVTPTATKASYWRRRLGWKPQLGKIVQKKVKKTLFRRPVCNSVRKGRGYELQGADALVAKPAYKLPADGKQVSNDKVCVLEHKTKDFDALGSVRHDFVFA